MIWVLKRVKFTNPTFWKTTQTAVSFLQLHFLHIIQFKTENTKKHTIRSTQFTLQLSTGWNYQTTLAVKEQTGETMTLPIRQRKETSDTLCSTQPTHQLQPNAARVKWDSCYRADNIFCSLEDLRV